MAGEDKVCPSLIALEASLVNLVSYEQRPDLSKIYRYVILICFVNGRYRTSTDSNHCTPKEKLGMLRQNNMHDWTTVQT